MGILFFFLKRERDNNISIDINRFRQLSSKNKFINMSSPSITTKKYFQSEIS